MISGGRVSTIFIVRLSSDLWKKIAKLLKNIKNYKLSTLREIISLTPQKAQLFQGTVKSNMKIIDENASDISDLNTAISKFEVTSIDVTTNASGEFDFNVDANNVSINISSSQDSLIVLTISSLK